MCAASFLTALPHGLGELAAVGVAAIVGLLVGMVALATDPRSALIVTLGLSVFAYAVEVLVWGDQPRSFAGLPGAVTIGDARVQTHYLLVIGVTLPVFAGMALFFTRTGTGKALTACASNPYAAKVIGIDVRRMGLLAFAIGGALGGLAGVLVTPVQQVTFDADVTLIVNGFAAAILGGLTRPAVTLAGGLLLGVTQALVAGYGNAAHQTDIALGLMIVVMIWRAARKPVEEPV
jgi:branched-chain amino acid transport system permease protein